MSELTYVVREDAEHRGAVSVLHFNCSLIVHLEQKDWGSNVGIQENQPLHFSQMNLTSENANMEAYHPIFIRQNCTPS